MPFRGERIKIDTYHNNRVKFDSYFTNDLGSYPSYYVIDGDKYKEFYLTVKKGGVLFASINGIITKIESMNKDGKLQFIEMKNDEKKLAVRLYYVDKDSIGVKVGDKVQMGDVIARSGVDQQ